MYKLLKINLARNSLRYIIRTFRIKEIFIPYYLCNVIRHSIIKEDCKINFYHIDDNFLPINDFSENDFILYPNYFGVCDKNVDFLNQKCPNMIIDNSHSFYSSPKGFACFNSARKFLPVFYGSYLWIKKEGEILLKEENKQILNLTDNEVIKFEEDFKNYDIKLLDDETVKNILQLNNRVERKEQFLKWNEKLKNSNLIDVDKNSESPFCYPYLLKTDKEADEFVKYLKNKKITVYRYWERLPQTYNEYKFYKRLVAIPLDKSILHHQGV